MLNHIKTILDLTKFKISLLSALSAGTGFILAAESINISLFFIIAGVFSLASGASALNQYQEKDTDCLMERTKKRPIPAGKLNQKKALLISCFFIVTGIFFLAHSKGALLLSLFILFWYNGFYTPLKKISSFAAVPGALAGALTPAIGWLAGGGKPFAYEITGIVFFFFIWQIPHFWLSIIYHGNDYEKTGMPVITEIFTEKQIVRVTFIWLLATAYSCLLIPLFITNSTVINIFLLIATMWLVWNSFYLLKEKNKTISFTFVKINIYAFIVISLLSLDRLIYLIFR